MLDIITRKEIKLKQGLLIPKQIFKMVKGYWKGIKRTLAYLLTRLGSKGC